MAMAAPCGERGERREEKGERREETADRMHRLMQNAPPSPLAAPLSSLLSLFSYLP
jgi:hypothetical protein